MPTKPKAVLLGAARPKEAPCRKTKRIKLAFGEEIRAVDLPLPSDLQELVQLIREEFDTDKLDIRYKPSSVYRVEVSVFGARHLPKADREGLCDARVRAEVTPADVYKFSGFHTANSTVRSRTHVVHKSLNPDFDETLVLLVDGTGDHTKHGWPRLLVTVCDQDGSEEEMIGQVDLDLGDMIAITARCHVWQREEQALREKLVAMQTSSGTMPALLQQAKERSLQRTIDYLVGKRTTALKAIEKMRLDLDWVPGCIPATKIVPPHGNPSKPNVRGADYKLAQLHMGVKIFMSEYQCNCWVNSYYDFVTNVLETVRGSLKERTDEYIDICAESKLTRRHFLSATNNLIGTEVTLQKAGITDGPARKLILGVIIKVMPRVIRFRLCVRHQLQHQHQYD